mmetsp:Transcript_15673/g.19111  ORF Transcript_15673/g.19111 Transcript_15673/m.19111 type:complete len:147 (+) Transcript_15673:224-664(+)
MGVTQSMHDKQSVLDINHNATLATKKTTKSNENGDMLQTETKQKSNPKKLEGFALVEYTCRKKRKLYDRCYRQKHSAFITGTKLKNNENGGDEDDENSNKNRCNDLFESYKDCIYLGMLQDRQKRGVKGATPESALGEFNYYEDEE